MALDVIGTHESRGASWMWLVPRVWLCQLDVFDAQVCGHGNWMSLVPTSSVLPG